MPHNHKHDDSLPSWSRAFDEYWDRMELLRPERPPVTRELIRKVIDEARSGG